MVTYEDLYLRLPEDRRKDLHDFVVNHGSSREAQARPFKDAWQKAVDAAAIEVERWLAEVAWRAFKAKVETEYDEAMMVQDTFDKVSGL